MGDLEQIELLESYIEEFGNELNNVKKASDYLKQIEEFQNEVTRTTNILDQSKENIILHQEILDSKLSLFSNVIQNIEQKQRLIEEGQKELSEYYISVSKKQERQLQSIQEKVNGLEGAFTESVGDILKLIERHDQTQLTLHKKVIININIFFGVSTVIGLVLILLLVMR